MKYRPIQQCPPYRDFAFVEHNPISFLQGPRSRANVLSKRFAEQTSDTGLRGRSRSL
jgi:hypothetical protein